MWRGNRIEFRMGFTATVAVSCTRGLKAVFVFVFLLPVLPPITFISVQVPTDIYKLHGPYLRHMMAWTATIAP
ncbi:hypothetical protein CPB86DRAFT_71554 [Serendipita vermifera]|nr:hypothetical protein CPB86DRAFT_71554 [Serendipita vermifera]